MVDSQRGSQPESKRVPAVKRRANPAGLGRLLIMTATVGLLTLGHGILWWAGLLVMGLILLAVGRPSQALWGIWSLVGIMTALAFWHLHMIPQWIGLTFVGLAAVQFAVTLVTARN